MEVDDDTDDGDDDGSDTGDDYDITTGPTSELSSSSTIDFKGKYSTTVFQERAMEVRTATTFMCPLLYLSCYYSIVWVSCTETRVIQ